MTFPLTKYKPCTIVTTLQPNLTIMEKYDVFISHASEDKDFIVRDLANCLIQKGYRVWYDEFTLSVGDGLRRSIDLGLLNSRYGIVVLSNSFFNKGWTNYELDGLTDIDIEKKGIILPIWHKLSKNEISAYSSSLANKIAISTEGKSIEQIVSQLEKKIGEYHYSVESDQSVFRSTHKMNISSNQRKAGFQSIKSIQTDRILNNVKCISRHDATIYPYSMNFDSYDFNFWQKVNGKINIVQHVAYDIESGKLISTKNEIITNDGNHIISKVHFKRITEGPIRVVCDFTTTNLFEELFINNYDFMEFNHNSQIEFFAYSFILPNKNEFQNIKSFADDIELDVQVNSTGLYFSHTIKPVTAGTFTKYSFINNYNSSQK